MPRSLAAIALTIAFIVSPPSFLAQQGGTTRYVYDDNGRLRAVVSPTGEAVIYFYDPAGNPTGIRRVASTEIIILDFSPKAGAEGDRVLIVGVGFGANLASNTVAFNGVTARVVEASPTAIVAEVPAAATTGPISVAAPSGTAMSDKPFTVSPRLRVTPETALVLPETFIQFTARLLSVSDNAGVVWSVNGVAGGNSSVGTISSSGLYQAPKTAPLSVIVRAASASRPNLYGEARVRIVDGEKAGFAAASVTVRLGASTPSILAAQQISVQFGSALSNLQAPGVSVDFGRRGSPVLASGVSVEFGGQAGRFNAAVSAIKGTHIASITPASLVRGTTITITIKGHSLKGATEVRFLLPSGQPDAAITASNIQVNADGAQLTASVAVAPSAALDKRIVVVTATAGRSPSTDLGENVIQVVAP